MISNYNALFTVKLFTVSNYAKIAVCDPVYPVYVDTNVMAGRTGTYDPTTEMWSEFLEKLLSSMAQLLAPSHS